MRRDLFTELLLVGVLAVAACGGGVAVAPPTQNRAPGPGGEPSPAAVSSATETPARTTAPSLPPANPAPPTAAPIIEMRSPVPTSMGTDLQNLGLDAKNLPRIAKLEPKVLRGVMKLFARSLGAKCIDCHQDGDFAAPTPQKRVAAGMWDEFAVKLTMADDSPLFCDSCHQGRTKQLDRTDKKKLARWMDASFVGPLKRKDGADHGCETCHVDMDMTFLTRWRTTASR